MPADEQLPIPPMDDRVPIEQDWVLGRIPLDPAGLAILLAQEAFRTHGLTHKHVSGLANAFHKKFLEQWTPPKRQSLLIPEPSVATPLSEEGLAAYGNWLLQGRHTEGHWVNRQFAELGDAVYDALILWFAGNGTQPENLRRYPLFNELKASASFAILQLALYRYLMKSVMTGEQLSKAVSALEKQRAIPMKAAAAKLAKHQPVKDRALALALEGPYKSVRDAANKVFPLIREEAKRSGWLTSHDRGLQTLYAYFLKYLPESRFPRRKRVPR